MLIVIVIVVFVVISNIGKLEEKVEQMKPEIRGVSLDWGEINANTTEVLGIITVYNPNSFPLPVTRVTCDIKMDGINIGTAETLGLQIKEEAEFPVKISVKIDNSKIPEFWTEHIIRNEKSEASITMVLFAFGCSSDIMLPPWFL